MTLTWHNDNSLLGHEYKISRSHSRHLFLKTKADIDPWAAYKGGCAALYQQRSRVDPGIMTYTGNEMRRPFHKVETDLISLSF